MVYWSKFMSETGNAILWLDYSQNIQLTSKNDVQAAYYSGKQHTLHDALIQVPNGDRTYVYHLSNDTNHDSVITDVIVNDIIANYPEVIESDSLVIRSDNCSMQYKSRYIFANMLKLASKLIISIYWFYGEAGHGHGLIDAMAWFGCKGPLRKGIIQDDNYGRFFKGSF